MTGFSVPSDVRGENGTYQEEEYKKNPKTSLFKVSSIVLSRQAIKLLQGSI